MPDNKNNEQTNQNELNPNEFELPTPHKKSEEPTTQTTGNSQENRNNEQDNENKNKHPEVEKDKPEERKGPADPSYQNADWQQDKLNEANNQKGVNVDEKGKPNEKAEGVKKEAYVSDKDKEKGSLGDTRKDSILNNPRTETYEEKPAEYGSEIEKANYDHTSKEEKRQKTQ